jgi:hypothetical protein
LLWREYIATGVRGREGQVNGQRRGSSSGGLGVIAAVSARVQRGPGPTRRVRVVEQMKAHGWWEVERAGTRGGRVGVGVQSARIVFVRSTCWGLGMGEGQNRSSAQPPTTSMRARGWRVARWAALQREGRADTSDTARLQRRDQSTLRAFGARCSGRRGASGGLHMPTLLAAGVGEGLRARIKLNPKTRGGARERCRLLSSHRGLLGRRAMCVCVQVYPSGLRRGQQEDVATVLLGVCGPAARCREAVLRQLLQSRPAGPL